MLLKDHERRNRMAKLACICGNILSNVASPNEVEGFLLRDIDLEFEDEKNCCDLMDMARCVWECKECGRLAFNFPDKKDRTVKWYKPEDGTPGNLMNFDTLKP